MPVSHPGDALHRLLHAYKRALRDAHRAAGIELPISHVRALKGVAYLPACTVQAIAERMHRDKSQITRVVKELRAAGLAQAAADPHDARARLLTLTDRGRALLARIEDAEHEAGARMARGLPPASLIEFVRLAEAMTANLDRPEDRP